MSYLGHLINGNRECYVTVSLPPHTTSLWVRQFLSYYDHDCLCIAGEHIQHQTLPYQPKSYNGVTATPYHIIVAQYNPPALMIHSWSGDLLQTITEQELGLQGRDYVHAVQCGEDGVLHMATGPSYSVHSLHAFRVRACSSFVPLLHQ